MPIRQQEELKDQWLARNNISLSAVQRQEELKDRWFARHRQSQQPKTVRA
jgi:hypothetical protein